MNSGTKKTVAVVCLLLVGTIFTVAMTGVLAGADPVPANEDVPDDEIARIQQIIAETNDEEISKVISDSEITKPIEILPRGRYEATILLEDSSLQDKNEFGFYYPPSPDCCCGCRALYRLFDGPDGVGKSVKFDTRDNLQVTPDKFGLWLNSPAPHQDWHRRIGGLYYSEKELNVDNFRHILIYKLQLQHAPNWVYYLIICEDWCHGGDRDYNDMVVWIEPIRLTPAPTAAANIES